MRFKAAALFLFLLCLMSGCAIQGSGPTGGDKDVTPPKVLKQEPANYTRNFKAGHIVFAFDEYFQLDNPQTEIIITPNPEGVPKYTVKGKTLDIGLGDVKLLPNTTYTFSFGSSIKDYNEGNALDTLQYVFSTGSYLDSLKISGHAESALNGTPAKNSVAILYQPNTDSAIYKSRPLYYTKVSDEGGFVFHNLPSSTFRLFVLNDKNGNFVLDEGEDVGMYPQLIKADSNIVLSKPVRLFTPSKPVFTLSAANVQRDKAQFKFNQPVDSFYGSYTENSGKAFSRTESDSVIYWPVQPVGGGNFKLVAKAGSEQIDTMFKVGNKNLEKAQFPLGYMVSYDAVNDYGTPLVIISPVPIGSIDPSKYDFKLGAKSLKFTKICFLDSAHTLIGYSYDFEPDSTYKITLYPGMLKSVSGGMNDTMITPITMPDKKNFAYLEVNVVLPDSGNQYIFQMVKEKGESVFEKILHSSGGIVIPYLSAGNYLMRVIYDKNRNGKFDAGNVISGLQPENVYYYKAALNLKQNWEMTNIQFEVPKQED